MFGGRCADMLRSAASRVSPVALVGSRHVASKGLLEQSC